MSPATVLKQLYNLNRLSVLVIDDNARMRALVKSVLTALNVGAVAEAGDGGDGLRLMARGAFDLIIADWVMDGLDGLAMTRRIRHSEDAMAVPPHVPIILMTAHSDPQSAAVARDAGVSEILTKPISAETLYRRIVAIIEQPRLFVIAPGYRGPCRRRPGREIYTGAERRRPGAIATAAGA